MIKQFIQDKEKEFTDFYYETGKYAGRKLGIEQYKDFLRQAISDFAKEFVEEILPNKNNSFFNIPVVITDNFDCTEEEKQMFLNGFNHCINQIRINAERVIKEME